MCFWSTKSGKKNELILFVKLIPTGSEINNNLTYDTTYSNQSLKISVG